ncbi:MAG TPA: hypothetical protein VMU95_39840 [Trebonia sp.]|nr:hypothetical protein [Trebonia sp.]
MPTPPVDPGHCLNQLAGVARFFALVTSPGAARMLEVAAELLREPEDPLYYLQRWHNRG